MEKFGIFNVLEQFGSMFKNQNEKKTAETGAGKDKAAAKETEHDYLAVPVGANQLEKFIMNHDAASRRIDKRNNKPGL